MSQNNQISSAELPLEYNFEQLKMLGLSFIKDLSGNEWSNFNDSDPGVTTLEQLCYALTELGYCNNFDIQDILCQQDDKIHFEGQFFQPDECLTSAPVTIMDYRKLILDRMDMIKNVYINVDDTVGQYSIYLYVDPSRLQQVQSLDEQKKLNNQSLHEVGSNNRTDKNKIIEAVTGLVNQYRNIAETFNCVAVLQEKSISLLGTIYLANQAVKGNVIAALKFAIAQYISPPIRQLGYQDMLALGYDSDEIFSGPQLKNGWIPDEDLTNDKIKNINLDDLLQIISAIDGVSGVDKLCFHGTNKNMIDIQTGDIAHIAIHELSWQQNQAVNTIASSHEMYYQLNTLQVSNPSEKIGATVALLPTLPSGKYRNIADYYSIQNTFPSFYGVGLDGVPANTNDYGIAQARQFKGYLMVFDQLLANQFSQLANVAQLFSFNPIKSTMNKSKKIDSNIPKQLFSPTYFCQELYNIPDVQPLLIGNQSYKFSFGEIADAKLQFKAWKQYREDPFNQYINGMREAMEKSTERDERRERMLNHLLARHGESGAFYDELITTAHWYGSLRQTRIMIKQMLLQNYQLLSYHRCKAYNLLGANALGTPGRFRLTRQGFEQLTLQSQPAGEWYQQDLNTIHGLIDLGYSTKENFVEQVNQLKLNFPDEVNAQITDGNTVKPIDFIEDGRLNVEAIDKQKRFNTRDFENYSSFELRLNLVFGLSLHYQQLSAILLTLIEQQSWSDEYTGPFESALGLSITVIKTASVHTIEVDSTPVLQLKTDNDYKCFNEELYQAYKDQLDWLSVQRQGFIFVENQLLLKSASRHHMSEDRANYFFLQTESIFPEYVCLTNSPLFQQQFNKLVRGYFPAHVGNFFITESFSLLHKTIKEFVVWHNALKENAAKWTTKQKESVKWLITKLLSSAEGDNKL